MRSQTGRAELLRTLAQGFERDSLTLDQVDTHWWGYERQRDEPPKAAEMLTVGRFEPASSPQPRTGPTLPTTRRPLTMPESWKVVARSEVEEGVAATEAPLSDTDLQPLCDEPVIAYQDLVPLPRLLPALRPVLSQGVRGGVDVPALVRHAAALRLPRRLPRLSLQRWHPDLVVVFDFAKRLTPYHFDMHRLAAALERECGRTGLSLRCLDHGPNGGWRSWQSTDVADELPAWQGAAAPAPGALILVVSDLGLLGANRQLQDTWRQWLADRRQAGAQVSALMPVGSDDLPSELCSQLPVRRWSPDSRLHPEVGCAGEPGEVPGLKDLMALVAAADRVDPPLLRAFRQVLPGDALSAGLEGRVWAHADVRAGMTCQVAPSHREAHLRRFARLVQALQTQQRLLRVEHHRHLRRALHWSEDLAWAQAAEACDERTEMAEHALRKLHALIAALMQGQALEGAARYADTARFLLSQLPESVQTEHQPLLAELRVALGRQNTIGDRATERGVAPVQETSLWQLIDDGEALWLEPQGPEKVAAALADELPLSAAEGVWVRIAGQVARWLPVTDKRCLIVRTGQKQAGEVALQLGRQTLRVARQMRPRAVAGWGVIENSWIAEAPGVHLPNRFMLWEEPGLPVLATGAIVDAAYTEARVRFHCQAGHDRLGVFLDLCLFANQEKQRFRYLEPGSFLMGSFGDLAGDHPDEQPRHAVTFTQGVWLADTPCTQGFYQTILGGHPSAFKGFSDSYERPVEQVSWSDLQLILSAVNRTFSPAGLEFSLPTEAEWEYACRAGGDAAYAWGDVFDPALANTNHGDGALNATSPVKRYPPNAWGLYDMHGNVSEWCADGVREYSPTAQTNPLGPLGDEDGRVVRGGSWLTNSRAARSTYRNVANINERSSHLGFRFSLRFQARAEAGKAGNPPPADQTLHSPRATNADQPQGPA